MSAKELRHVDVEFSDEQQEIRKALRDVFDRHSDSPAVRAVMATETGYDAEVWRRVCEQTGLAGLAIPEQYGGVGFGFTELVVAMEEMGRALFPSPFLASSVLTAYALLHAGDEAARAEHLPGLAAGETLGALALAEPGRRDVRAVEMAARADGDGWRLDGVKTHVIDGLIADLIVVGARVEGGSAATPYKGGGGRRVGGDLALFTVDRDAAGLTRTALPTLDQTRKQARLTFADTPARLLGVLGADAALERVLALAEIAVAAEAVGGAGRCLEATVEYTKGRVQFGRPIGSFQAIKHRCADLYVEVETARSALYYAAWAATEAEAAGLASPGELAVMAPLAMTTATAAYRHVAEEMIQLHGGVGFTWEYDCHLYLKRAITSAHLLGERGLQRERIAALAGI
ncbi:acyl-CoA dehydrogenase family protein [Embleya hyalina]|uniref:Acyl-CoA dehydrogenase n=1 Tax=Embleya hyalina TaxID=516124 RepID=A0A401YRZ3_9ACTN|nr:acyl-CoA dehydrogenase family protein [Embleya hyalina]GCD97388.1 acyl-CoA dehydrogenase [Embleya hyalina]